MSNTNNNNFDTMKDTVSSCFISKEQEIHRLQGNVRLSKGGCMKGLKELQSHFTSLSDDLKDFGGVPTFKRTFSQDMDQVEKHLTKKYFIILIARLL
ncbi:hypothetical protein Tco_1512857 [Tanacetum coccineum]